LIHFADAQHGYIVERFGPAAGSLYSGLVATDDGGIGWSYRTGPAGSSGPPTPLFPSMPAGTDDVVVEGPTGLVAVQASGVVSGIDICTSSDGGRRWSCPSRLGSPPAHVGTLAAEVAPLPSGRLQVASLSDSFVLQVAFSADRGATLTVETQVSVPRI
jgi:hypothetical protein